MFRGLFEHTIDNKGRTSFPVRFREVLNSLNASVAKSEETLIVTTGIEPCLVAYPPSTWQAFEQKLAELSQFDPAVVKLKRLYVAAATECSIDKHGRLLIPPMLRAYAGLEHEVVWAGMVTTLEIWSKAAWAKQTVQAREDPKAVSLALKELGL